MYTLAYRPCVGRRVARSVHQFSRLNSSKASSSPAAPRTAPSKAASTTPPAVEASSEKSASNARIASSWDNISIPSREEILNRPRKVVPGDARGSDYKPDLSYLKKGSPTSFASRLAANAGNNDGTPSESTTNPDSKPPKLSKSQKQKQREREQRAADLTAQRRAERLRREAAQAQEEPKAQAKPVRQSLSSLGTFEGTDQFAPVSGRKGQSSQRGQQSGQLGEQSGQHNQQHARRGGSASRGGRSGTRAQDSKRSRQPVIRKTPTTEIDQTLASEDVTLETLENGGDDKAPAEFRNPDFIVTNLDDLFGPTPAQRFEDVTRATTPFTEDQVQWLRETYGGDYLRLAPHSDADFNMEPRKLGPLKHAQMVLSKRGDIPFGARKDALDVIGSALRE
ncbi:hypothetical protein DXG03_008464 [Asterophora parasitica]|uniref:Uncharacterized protein n=1 Tax=Asterophora parasitica TaxID=117018 RepID=A0A9P7KD84_9AGAR|nr:hypothetical protein DXG03_008464 [Asterophora parasitica]